ncbi:MAG TPA: hypothetical protein VM097_07180 [Mycobacteriales bacterium]|nr:hypothetical protein [Mycobacteriales bacterium]
MRRTARLSLVLAGCAALGLAVPAHAGSAPAKLVVTDATDDALSAPLTALTGGADELAKMTWTSTGTTTKRKVGKKTVTTYTPKNLVVILETAGDIATDGTTQYDVEGSSDGCGDWYVYVTPGAALEAVFGSCDDDDSVDFGSASFAVAGKTITFTIPLGSVPGLKAGKSVTGLNAYTGFVDPVTGDLGPVFLGADGATDTAPSDAAFKIV